MKILLTTATALLLSLTTFAQKVENTQSKSSELLIDGNSSDWSKYSLTLEEKSNIYYAIINDNNSIYFLLKFPDRNSQLKVLRSGLEIKIDKQGKNNFPSSFIFPYSIDRENNDPLSYSITGIKPNTNLEERKSELIKNSTKIKLTGFNNGLEDVMLNTSNNINISAALNFEENNLIYEVSFPINLIFKGDLSNYKSPFNFQFNLQALPHYPSESSDSRCFENNSINQKAKLSSE